MNRSGLVAVLEQVVGREQPAVELIASIVECGGSAQKAAAISGQPAGHVLATGYHVLFAEASDKPARSGVRRWMIAD
jgi:hypothetical protein